MVYASCVIINCRRAVLSGYKIDSSITIYSNSINFTHNATRGEGLITSEGKKWERNGKLLTPAFHFDVLKGYIVNMNKAADTFLGQRIYRGCTTPIRNDLDTFDEHAIFCGLDVQINSTRKEHDKLIDYVHTFTGNLIENRRNMLQNQESSLANDKPNKHLDFLDILLTAKDDEGKGHDTTSSTISWAIYALGKYPESQEKVYLEVCDVLGERLNVNNEDITQLKYLTMFIKETMRMYPTIVATARRHSSPITLDGIEITVGPRVDINIYALHHNKNVWDTPEVFIPERFSQNSGIGLYSFIPFSAGPRNCIGQNFAMNEIKITIAKVVKQFRVSVQDVPEPIFLPEIVLKSSNGLHVKLFNRSR